MMQKQTMDTILTSRVSGGRRPVSCFTGLSGSSLLRLGRVAADVVTRTHLQIDSSAPTLLRCTVGGPRAPLSVPCTVGAYARAQGAEEISLRC